MSRSGIIRPFGACIAMLLGLVLASSGCSDQSASPEQLIASAKQERDKGQYRSAIIHLKSALQDNPQNAEARYLLGVTFNDVGDYKSAEVELRKAMELRYDLAKVKIGKSLVMMRQFQKVLDEVAMDADVGNAVQAEILTLRGQALIGLRRSDEGRKLIEQALAKQPDYPDALLVHALLVANEKKLDESARLIERALASAPKNVDAWLMKGDLVRFKGDNAGALAAYLKAVEVGPENVVARLNVASLQIAAGDFDRARNQLAEVDKIAPNVVRTKFLRALIELKQKKYTVARDTVLQALKLGSDDLPSLLLAGIVEHALGAHAQAQTHLERVVERAPGYLYARKLLVASLAKSGKIQRAIEVLQPGIQQAPEDGELMGIAGEAYLQNNEFARAVQYFEKAVKIDPKSAAARTGLGLGRMGAGDTDRALADLQSATELDPERYQADLLLIVSHVQRANYDGALKAMQTLEKKQPTNPLTYKIKAAIYLGKKDEATARRYLEHALELNPTYVDAAMDLAQLDLKDKKPALARRRFEAILEKDKNSAAALMGLATIAPGIGATPKELIDWLERARGASPNSAQPSLLLARTYARARDPKKAVEVAQQAAATHPNNAEVLDTLGDIQLEAGAKEQALATFNKLVALQPKSATALLKLAMTQVANGEQTRAANTLRKAVSMRPGYIDAQVALAALELKSGGYPAAAKIAQQMQKQSPQSPAGYVLEGDILIEQKKYPQAITAYEGAYKIAKSSATFVKLHGAYAQGGRREEAEKRLAQWLKESPDDRIVRRYAAQTSASKGDYKSAIEHYEWLLKTEPDDVLLLNNLAWTYQQVKDTRALATAERAYKLKPDNGTVADTLGWILIEQGSTQRGIELLQKAVLAAPHAPQPRYRLAQAFIKTGNRAKARQELEKLLADSPGSRFEKEAKQLLDSLR